MRLLIACLMSCMLLLFFCVSRSYAFYCGNELVSKGDTTAEVFLKCGEPFWKERHLEKERSGGRKVYIVIEDWIYNFGPSKWLYFLRFENGELIEIDTRGYGYRTE